MGTVYVLKCEGDRYYVGRTNDIETRLKSHFDGYGSAFTKKYKPIETVEIVNDCDRYDELVMTLYYMEKYSISKVRGSAFCNVELSSEQMRLITDLLRGINDKCYKCGGVHFAMNCTESGVKWEEKEVKSEEEEENSEKEKKVEKERIEDESSCCNMFSLLSFVILSGVFYATYF